MSCKQGFWKDQHWFWPVLVYVNIDVQCWRMVSPGLSACHTRTGLAAWAGETEVVCRDPPGVVPVDPVAGGGGGGLATPSPARVVLVGEDGEGEALPSEAEHREEHKDPACTLLSPSTSTSSSASEICRPYVSCVRVGGGA